MLYHFPSSAENNCLLKGSVTELELAEKTAKQKRAGEIIDLNHQCKLAVGTSSQACLPPATSTVSHEKVGRWVLTQFQQYINYIKAAKSITYVLPCFLALMFHKQHHFKSLEHLPVRTFVLYIVGEEWC